MSSDDTPSQASTTLTLSQKTKKAKQQYEKEEQLAGQIQLNQQLQSKGFIQNFGDVLGQKSSRLAKNIFGDYSYVRQNKYSVKNKIKILEYLQQKCLLMKHQLQQNNKKSYYNYDPDFFSKKPKDLPALKGMLLQGRTQVQMAEESLQRLHSSKNYYKANFLNEAAYQFDRQRYCSMMWGIMTGALINSTIYQRGRTARKAALIVTLGHIFGQISYHVNLDQYFDSVNMMFQEQAQKYMKQHEKIQIQKQNSKFIKNQIQ